MFSPSQFKLVVHNILVNKLNYKTHRHVMASAKDVKGVSGHDSDTDVIPEES